MPRPVEPIYLPAEMLETLHRLLKHAEHLPKMSLVDNLTTICEAVVQLFDTAPGGTHGDPCIHDMTAVALFSAVLAYINDHSMPAHWALHGKETPPTLDPKLAEMFFKGTPFERKH